MSVAALPRRAAIEAWTGRHTGPPLRVVLAALATVAGAEIAFGRSTTSDLGPIPVPTGVPLGLILNGAIDGILYGLVALGIILIYRANRVISFAQAGLGSVPALLALILVTNHHWPYLAAAGVMLVGSALTGLFVEAVVLRGFRNRPRVIYTIATIGVAQGLTLGELWLPGWLAGGSIPPENLVTPLSGFRTQIGGIYFNGNHVLVIAAGAGAMLGLHAFFQRSRIGIAVRGAAENGDRALLLGIPAARLTTLVWVIAGMLSGIAILLRASTVGVPFGGLELSPTVLLYGLGAAVIAGMERMSTAMLAGMLVGVIEQTSVFGTNKPDLAVALMLPLILVALLPRARQLSRAYDTGMATIRTQLECRGIPVELRNLPEVRALRILAAAAGLGFFLLAPVLVGGDNLGFADLVVIFAIIGVSLVILSGWAGQISLGQWGFAGVGAAVAGGLAANHGQDFFVTVVAAGLAGALLAVVLGLPSLRIQGLYLAVVTLAFAATVKFVILSPDYASWLLPTGPVERPVLWSRLPTDSALGFYYLCVAFLVLAYLCARAVRRSRSGRVFVATRDNVRAAQSFAVSSTRTRLAAFAVSGFIAAVGGALFAYETRAVDKGSFDLSTNIEVFMFTVLGGVTSVGGAIAGAVYYEGLRYVANAKGLAGIDTIGLSAGVLLALGFFPCGISQAAYNIRDAVLRRIAARNGVIVPSLLADRRGDDGGPAPVRAPRPVVAAAPGADPVLLCHDVGVAYDGVRVLFGVDLEVRPGEIVALLGTNGAGKSTLLRAVSGLSANDRGTVVVDGRDIGALSAQERVRLGIVQVPGGRSIFPTLTVAEHFRLARWALTDAEATHRRLDRVLDMFPRLRERWGQLAGNLSGGEQQQLGLAMAFIAKPRLLMIDELSLGLAPSVVEQLLVAVRALRDEGTTVLLVEQSINVALTVAERAYFMEKGEVRFQGSTRELLHRDDIVWAVFLGRSDEEGGSREEAAAPTVAVVGEPAEGGAGAAAAPALEARGLTVSFGGIVAVSDVSLSVQPGQILGIIGPNGAGKTTLFDMLSGFLRPRSGRVLLADVDVTDRPPDERAWLGLGRSFQDARIFASMTVAENIATALERHLPVHDHLASALGLPAVRDAEDDVAWSVADLVELMNLQAFRDKFVYELSTGSRRVVDLAMVLAHDPSVLILDEPSSGIAQREAEALAPLLHRIRAETGCAMLVIEHDMPLITSVSDRLMALDLGRVIADGAPDQVIHDPLVVAAYLGTDQAALRRSGVAPELGALAEVPA